MPATPSRASLYAALFALGVLAQVAQAVLARELLVVFYGNEITLGAFFASWLLWVGVGSTAVALGRRRLRRPPALLVGGMLALPWLLASQVLLVRVCRHFLEASPAELLGLGELMGTAFVVTLPTGLALGAAFPLGCRLLTEAGTPEAVRAASRLYIFDALGAFAGGLLFTFVLIEWAGVWPTLGWSALLAAGAALWVGAGRALRLAAAATLVAGVALLAPPVSGPLHRAAEALRFEAIQPGLDLVDTVETRYGHLAVARLGEQYSVLHDGRIGVSFPDPKPVAQAAAFLQAQSAGAHRVLMLGGADAELAAELMRYPVDRLDLVADDEPAFQTVLARYPAEVRAAFDDPRLRVHFQDGRRFVNAMPAAARYDLVLVLGVDPASAQQNRYFTRELYARVAAAMPPGGVICTAVDSASNYLGRDVQSYGAAVYRTLKSVFAEVIVVPGDRQVMCASPARDQVTTDPDVLARRYEAIPLDERVFPPEGFRLLLEPERVAFVQRSLEASDAPLNTDLRPVTYYLNMILWGKFTASGFVDLLHALARMGPWPYLIPLALLVAVLTLRQGLEGTDRARRRRTGGTLALAALGFIAMAAQLLLIFSYQAHVGFAFGRIALLNGLFMTGLALGAGLVGQRLAARPRPGLALAGVLALVALGCALLPGLLEGLSGLGGAAMEGAYLALVTLAGLLTGTGFPLGVHQAHLGHGEVLRSTGVAAAADNLGGALGGLVTGAFMVPILGVGGTSAVLAGAAVLALVPLLLAEPARWAPAPLEARGFRAFPAAWLSWTLLYLSLTVFALGLLVRGTAAGPQVQFDAETLEVLSGSTGIRFEEHPFPHYLGEDGGGRTVSLSSMPVAGDIRGYAGPLNLLVSVDESGTLRGARHIASEETPAYIHGIDEWLAGLRGADLSAAPLELGRVDALTGATVSSEAALAAINRAARAGGRAAFGVELAPTGGAEAPWWRELVTPRFLGTLALLALFFPVYFSGRDRTRLLYQLAVLLVLGVAFNSLVTEVDLVNLGRGSVPGVDSNPVWYLLVVFTGVTGLLFGQVYCGYVCPFGALQEMVSRTGRRLGLRRYADRRLDRAARYLKFLLLAGALALVWITGELAWVSFNPMQHVFRLHLAGWIGWIAALSLLGSLFYYRFWCRYLCPMGAFLALSNKVAVLAHRAPARGIRYCDLGVRDEFDVDCIHCNRCIDRVDLGREGKPGRVD
ncbi:MAG: 4Fe-4S binding protein [Chromatiales bacterium]|jgi:spermidine synthase